MCERASFNVEAMVRGYHAYQDVWRAVVGEELSCQRESGNLRDPFAVAVMKDNVVGHVPRKISSICSLFIRRGGSIRCRVIGSRRYSEDLPQGGLEVPCVLMFDGSVKDVNKVEKLVRLALTQGDPPAKKKRRLVESEEQPKASAWVQLDAFALTLADKEAIKNGSKLNDRHINYAQKLIHHQFPTLKGLQLTLYQQRRAPPKECADPGQQIQIIHSRDDHWIVASTINSSRGKVQVYDSVYNSIDEETKATISNLFGGSQGIKMAKLQKQNGGNDCGLFAIAVTGTLAFGLDPTKINFDQSKMRSHLVSCFEQRSIALFPTK